MYSFQGSHAKLMRIYLCNLEAVHNYVLDVIYIVPKVSNANIKMENVTKVKLQERVKKTGKLSIRYDNKCINVISLMLYLIAKKWRLRTKYPPFALYSELFREFPS